jgi:hypothetical protein
MTPSSIFLPCAVVILGAVAALPARALPLVADGKSAWRIYHDAGAPGSVVLAGRDIQRVVKIATGVELPIVNQPASPMIALGDTEPARKAGFTQDAVPFEGFVIATRGEDLFIVGHDVPPGKERWDRWTSDGTFYGACAFLERVVGVRWLMPGEAGEDVPRADRIDLPALDLRQAPAVLFRAMPYVYDKEKSVIEWKQRNRVHPTYRLSFGHSWDDHPALEDLKAHPEWMVMREDGTRDPAPAKKDRAVRYCLSQPAFFDAYARSVLEDLRKNPRRYQGVLTSSDGYTGCRCPDCLKLTLTDDGGRWNNFGGYGQSISPLMLRFYDEVGRRVAQECPDRIVGGLIYRNYQYPPDPPVKLGPNVLLDVAVLVGYGYKFFKPQRASELGPMLDGWSKSAARLGWSDYSTWMRNPYGVPLPPGRDILKLTFPLIAKHQMTLVHYTGHEGWGAGALHNYVVARLMWDPTADVDALCAEFLRRAYGPEAAPLIERIYARVEADLAKYIRAYGNAPRDPSYDVDHECMKAVCAPNLAEIEKLYAEALARTKAEGPRKRLEMFGDVLTVMHYNLRKAALAGPKPEASPLYKDDAAYKQFLAARAQSIAIDPNSKLDKDGLFKVLSAPDTRQATVPKLMGGFPPPVVDGVLNDPAWEESVALGEFRLRNTRTPAAQQTTVRLLFDTQRLYLGVECRDVNPKAVQAACIARDSAGIFNDDTFELFLGPKADYATNYWHVVFNAAGAVYDAIAPEKAYNLDLQSVAKITDAGWTVEIAIPFASLGLKDAPFGKTWRANFCRIRKPDPAEASSWNAIDRGFHEPKNFGVLKFAEK